MNLLLLIIFTIFGCVNLANFPDKTCQSDTEVVQDCNTCKCSNGYLTDCTKYRCYYQEGKNLFVECIENEVKINDCHMCFCHNEQWECSDQKVCHSMDEPTTPKPNRGNMDTLTKFGDNGKQPPCIRVNQFTFQCNLSRVGSRRFSKSRLQTP